MTDRPAPRPGRRALRLLGWFWGLILLVLGAGAGALHVMGPPPPMVAAPVPPPAAAPAPPAPAPTAPALPQAAALPPVIGPAGTPPVTARITPTPRAPGAAIPPPDPALAEPSGLGDGSTLPRIAGGLAPMIAHAAGAPPLDARPRVAILLADFAMREADSEEALRLLPSAVSFAVSPYAPRPGPLVARAREQGHELLAALPMEPRGYPIDDPGARAMLTGAPMETNAHALRWALSRLPGPVGATGALGALRGERFAASEQMGMVQEELGRRGLLYIDPRPGGKLPPGAAARAVDLVIDEPAVRAEIDARLERLEQLARDRGAALGLASAPTPVTIDRLAAWASLLAQRGIVLVPVSALVNRP